jgi:hypothetical protein
MTATVTPALKEPTTNMEYVEAQDKARLLKTKEQSVWSEISYLRLQ